MTHRAGKKKLMLQMSNNEKITVDFFLKLLRVSYHLKYQLDKILICWEGLRYKLEILRGEFYLPYVVAKRLVLIC